MRSSCARALFCCAVVAATFFSSVGHAEVVWVWDSPDPNFQAPSIAEVNAQGGLLVGDKLFTDFTVISSGNAPFLPTAADIRISGLLSDGDYGVSFNGPWFALTNQVLDTTIKFKVSVFPENPGVLIKDNTLGLTAFAVNNSDAFVSITENVYSAPPPQPQSIADKFVFASQASSTLLDHENFHDATGAPAAFPAVWVVKDILLYGGSTAVPGHPGAFLSEFTQSFSQTQVPEPQTFVLLACGLPGLALLLWRRRARR
jgi:hypothetical protein